MLVLKLASVENTCVELDVGYKIIFKKPFKRTPRVNYSRKKQKKICNNLWEGGFCRYRSKNIYVNYHNDQMVLYPIY